MKEQLMEMIKKADEDFRNNRPKTTIETLLYMVCLRKICVTGIEVITSEEDIPKEEIELIESALGVNVKP